jgi:hypothetical protein
MTVIAKMLNLSDLFNILNVLPRWVRDDAGARARRRDWQMPLGISAPGIILNRAPDDPDDKRLLLPKFLQLPMSKENAIYL